jgi:uncharacterized protein YbbC (DUF1343 family)
MAAKIFIILSLLITFFGNSNLPIRNSAPPKFLLGDEAFIGNNLDEVKDKKVGLITNQTGILSNGSSILDVLIQNGINVVKIFSPEHGIRGDESYSDKDEKTGIPTVSLFGDKMAPSRADLQDVDVMIYDIQDVGARFYTYTSSLYYCIESASANNKKIIIFDRPMIINPNYVDGFMLDRNFESFVGKIPVPICYGMTCGELADYLQDYLSVNPELVEVSKMINYSRSIDYDQLNLTWVKPSPNIFTSATAVAYPATCFLEGTNVSEGRGSDKPFEYFGAPWCNGDSLAKELSSYNFEGVVFEPITFTPNQKISAYPPKYFGEECPGVYIKATDKRKFEAAKIGVAILISLNKLFKEFKFNKDNYIDKLAGTDKLRKMVLGGTDLQSIVNSWKDELDTFKATREKYLLYR